MKKPLIFHHLLFSLYPVLTLYNTNIASMAFVSILPYLILLLAISIICYSLLARFINNPYRTAIFVSLFFVLFWGFRYFYYFLLKTSLSQFIAQQEMLLLIFSVLLFSFLVLIIRKRTSSLPIITKILNAVSVVLVLSVFIQIIGFRIENRLLFDSHWPINQVFDLKKSVSKTDGPDIYYFIFDRYASNETLENRYGFKNDDFLNYLENKGFYIARSSWANYTLTMLSLSSSLNSIYLKDFPPNDTQLNNITTTKMIKENELAQFLKTQGYYYIQAGTYWTQTHDSVLADKNINRPFTEFFNLLFSRTLLYSITENINIPILKLNHRQYETTLFVFKEIEKIPEMKVKTYLFAHFLMTHPPYIFNEDGSFYSGKLTSEEDKKNKYIETIKFTNKKIEELLDNILEKSKDNPPIIVIQSDEGPYPVEYEASVMNFDWSHAEENTVAAKMGILNAFYLPKGTEDLYSTITPVNSFRVILNKYFDQNLPLLPDEIYLSNWGKPYTFFNYQRKN